MKTFLRDLLRCYWKEHASKQIKHQKSKLLIYDEYLKKYVSPEELLIPRIKDENKGARTKSKQLFIFDVLFKKFVNPKLDLLVPGIKSLDLLIKCDTSNIHTDIRAGNKDYFWGKKTSKKNAVVPLPLTHSKTCTETEPPQTGWAGQQTKKPKTDPRPELSKPECKFGPGKDPKKKKPPKKKNKKSKYLVCAKVKEPKKNIEHDNSKRNVEQTTKEHSKGSKEITYNEENCYSNSKEKEKQLKSQDSINDVSKSKSIEKQEKFLVNLIKLEKNKNNKSGTVKVICKKLFPNKVNVKEQKVKENISDQHNKTNIYDIKINTSQNKEDLNKPECDLKSNQSKSLVCKKQCPNSLITTEDSKATSLYLCKRQKDKPEIENKLGKTKSTCSKMLCPSSPASANEIKLDKVESSNDTKQDKDKEKMNNTCCKQLKGDDCSKSKTIKDASIDQMKQECKKAIIKRPKTSPIETHDSLQAKEHTTSNNIRSDVCKSRTSSHNCMERPKTAHLQTPCAKAASIITSEQSRQSCNSNKQKVKEVNNKCNQSNEEPCKRASAKKSRVMEKSNETNHNTSRCLKVDPESTEKLHHIKQEELFKKADSSPDLSKCSSYMGFKVKKSCSKTKSRTETDLKNHKNDSTDILHKEECCKKKDTCETSLKTSKGPDDKIQSKAICDSLGGSKSKSFINKKPAKQTLNNTSQDLEETRSTTPTCVNDVSICNAKQKSKSKIVSGSDCKGSLKNKKKLLSQKKSSKKISKKCKNKKALDVKAGKSKLKKVGKKKNITCNSNNESDSNRKKLTEKSSLCTKYALSSEYKELKENIKYDTDKAESCSENFTNQTEHDKDKNVCCEKTEKGTDNTCGETSKAPNECQTTPGKGTMQCPKGKTTEITINKNNIGEHKPKEANEKKKKAYVKPITTGALQRKKSNRCTKIKSFESVKTQNSLNKSNKSQTKKASSTKSQKIEKTSGKVKRSKSAKICSEKKPIINGDKNSKKSKSKHSICPKTSNGDLLKGSKKTSKSQKEESMKKLNKLVRRAKCSTANGISKKETNERALICPKSTPNIHEVKNNDTSGLSKPNGAMAKKPSASKTSDINSKKVKGSKKEIKNTSKCSFHTLQKSIIETPNKNSKSTDVKSFSELKKVDTSEKDILAECFNKSNCSSQLDLEWNKQKSGRINIKDTGVTEGCKLENTEPKTEQNCLEKQNGGLNVLIEPKNKHLFPSFKNDKYFQLLVTSLTHETEPIKQEQTNTFKSDTKDSKNDNCILERNSLATIVTKSLSNIKEYSKVSDNKQKYQKNSIALDSKETHNVNKSHKTNSTNNKLNIQNKDATLNKNEMTITNKITNKDLQENDTFKKGTQVSNGNMSSITKGATKETCLGAGFQKEEVSMNDSNQTLVSKVQIKATDAPKHIKDIKSVTQAVCTGSAASNDSSNNAFITSKRNIIPHKTKSLSSFNTLKLHDPEFKYAITGLRSAKKEKELKTINRKHSQDPKINVQNIESQDLGNNTKHIETKNQNLNNLNNQKEFQNKEKGNKTKLFINVGNKCLKYNYPGKIKSSTASGSASTNKTLINDELEKHVSRLQTIGPTMTKIIKPVYLNSRVSVNENQEPNKNILSLNTSVQGKAFNKITSEGPETENKTLHNFIRQTGCSIVDETVYDRTLTNAKINVITQNKTEKIQELAIKKCLKDTLGPYLQRVSVNGNKESNNNSLSVNISGKGKLLGKEINKDSQTENKVIKEQSYIKQTKKNVDETVGDKTITTVKNTFISPNNIEKLQKLALKKCLNNALESNLQKVSVNEHIESNKNILPPNTPVKGKPLEKLINKGSETKNKSVKENNYTTLTRKSTTETAHDRTVTSSINNTFVTPNNTEKLQELAIKCLRNKLEPNLQRVSINENKESESNKNILSVNTPVKVKKIDKILNKGSETVNKDVKNKNCIRQTKGSVLDETVSDTTKTNFKKTFLTAKKLQQLVVKKVLSNVKDPNLQRLSVNESKESNKNILNSVKGKALEKVISKESETENKSVNNYIIQTRCSVVDEKIHDRKITNLRNTVVKQNKSEKLQETAIKKGSRHTLVPNLQRISLKENKKSNKNFLAVNTPKKGKSLEKIIHSGETKKKAVKENNCIRQTKKDLVETVHDTTIINPNNCFVTPNNIEKLKELSIKNCLNNIQEPNLQRVSENQYKESNKNILPMTTLVKEKKLEKIINKGANTENKVLTENSNIRRTRSVIETVYDREVKKASNTFVTPNNTKKLQDTAIKKILNSTPQSSDLPKGKIKKSMCLKKVITAKPSVKGTYSPKSKIKYQVISKRHRKFTNYNYKKPPLIDKKQDSGNYKKSEAKEIIKHHSDKSKVENKKEQENRTQLNVAASLSSKQTKLLMEQPFYKKPKCEPSTDKLLHMSPSETTLLVSNKESGKNISSPEQPARHLRLLMEQTFYKKTKSEPYPGTSTSLSSSISENNLSKANTKNKLHISKSENNLIAPSKEEKSGISPRKQQSSIRSQLQRKMPMKAVIKQVKLKKTEKD